MDFEHPGIFVEEVDLGAHGIAGVPTSTAGFVGVSRATAARVGEVAECTTLAEFRRFFGDAPADAGAAHLAHAVAGFFANGGRRCHTVHVGDTDAVAKSALPKLAAIDELSLVVAPGVTDAGARAAIAAHCSEHGRFAILDTPEDEPGDPPEPTANAALYFPWIEVDDPAAGPGETRFVPPSGHLAGIYARVDASQGVRAPLANQPVAGAVGLRHAVAQPRARALQEGGMNLLRQLGGEVVVWGARTLSDDPDWRYVSVRRLFLYLEHSLDEGTKWAVFEPNDEPLWAKVRAAIAAFLHDHWRSGALAGDRPDDAFFVRCDRTTMTQDDIDSGRLVALVGVAPLRPAEFVIFRIGQWTADADPDREP